MENQKKILVLGGTGAMGVYLVPELLRRDTVWTSCRWTISSPTTRI